VGLEQPEFPHALDGNAAGRQVGDAAAVKLQASVGQINGVGEHGYPGGPNLGHPAGDQGQDQVQVMDHQVPHHIHIGAPLLEERQTMNLDEMGLLHPGR